MKCLIVHNNNLPDFLLTHNPLEMSGDEYLHLPMDYQNSDGLSYDSYISKKLEETIKNQRFDAIILPCSLDEGSYMEYTGLRVAAHIRLTKLWNCRTTPIIFMGRETREELMTLSPLGPIMFSYNIFLTDINEEGKFIDYVRDVVNSCPYDEKNEKKIDESPVYQRFINQLNIQAPSNYGSGHHSIANEWAVHRWLEMFNISEESLGIKLNSTKSLYFKYLLRGNRQHFTKGRRKDLNINTESSKISGIEGDATKTVCYIDDEGEKGWNKLIGRLLSNSGINMITFPFQKGLGKVELIKQIEDFIKVKAPCCNCYLIDIRLHDDDNGNDKADELSGVQIAHYIKEKVNKGNQIVMFTASNKTWNYEESVVKAGAVGYVVKESPEYNYSCKDTLKNFDNFKAIIRKAINKSYIALYVNIMRKFEDDLSPELYNLLDSFIDMLSMNDRKNIRENVLNLYVFVETYIKERYYMFTDKDKRQLKDKCTGSELYSYKYRYKEQKNGKDLFLVPNVTIKKDGPVILYARFHDKPLDNPEKDEEFLDDSNDLGLVVLTLFYYYKLGKEKCNMFLKLNKDRSQKVAHNGGEPEINLDGIKEIFEEIIVKMLEKDYPKEQV